VNEGAQAGRTEATILHLDLDAFYASVEQRERPELRGKPVVVGGLGARGVVAAASYEARRFGIHSAIPTTRARRLCPHAEFLTPRIDFYADVSREVMTILRSATPLVEPLSLDEAFLDVSGSVRLLGSGPEIAAMLRSRIRAELALTASVGVATTKMLAKIASDASKPDGLLVIEPGTELAYLHPLPVRRIWGVGPATQEKLKDLGVESVGQLARTPERVLVDKLGEAAGRHLYALAWNRDLRPVEPNRVTKSIGHEETFATDRSDRRGLEQDVVRMADRVATRLREHDKVARTVQLKLRYRDFDTITRARTLPDATDLAVTIAAAARDLLDAVDLRDGIRLLGVTALGLEDAVAVQGQLPFDGDAGTAASPRDAALERTIDAVRARFGTDAVGRAAHAVDGRVRTDRRGSLYGPDDVPVEGSAPGEDEE
jgi:DNA polymerase-4